MVSAVELPDPTAQADELGELLCGVAAHRTADGRSIPLLLTAEDRVWNGEGDVPSIPSVLANAFCAPPTAPPALQQVPLTNAVTRWMQDHFEFVLVRRRDCARFERALLDLGDRPELVTAVAHALGIQLIVRPSFLSTRRADDGDQGGNLEALPSGRMFVGDSIGADFLAELTSELAQPPLTVPASWLSVAHVDYHLSVVPTNGSCGAAIAYADPIRGLELLAGLDESAFTDVQQRHRAACVENHGLCGVRAAMLAPFALLDRAAFLDALAYYGGGSAGSYDAARPPRQDQGEPIAAADHWVRWNLEAAAQIQAGLSILLASGECLDPPVPVPVVFRPSSADVDRTDLTLLPDLPATTNGVVLGRDYLAGMPIAAAFRDDFARTAGERGFDVHFVDSLAAHHLRGNVHCQTQVLRW